MTEPEQPEPVRGSGLDVAAPDGIQDELLRADAAATADDDLVDAERPASSDTERGA